MQASEPDNETSAEAPVVPPAPPPGGYPSQAQAKTPDRTRRHDERTRTVLMAGVVVVLIVLLGRATHWWGPAVLGGLVVMIFLHELGHYVVAKRTGMKVTEFFLGFGPKLWSFRRGETEYGVKLLWVGAYVKIIGMNNLDEVDPVDEARAYRQKPFRARLGVAVAGSAMHFVQALLLIFLLLTLSGVQGGSLFSTSTPKGPWAVSQVEGGSAADHAGLHAGDRVQSVNGVPAQNYETMRATIAQNADKPVRIVYEHGGRTVEATVRLGHQADDPHTGKLGIGAKYPTAPAKRLGVATAIPQTFQDFGTVAKQSVVGLGQLFSPSGISRFYRQLTNSESKAGPPVDTKGTSPSHHDNTASAGSASSDDRPVSIYGVFRVTTSIGQAAGWAAVLTLFVLINVFIGIFNLTPLLPFDGGHVVVAAYEKVQEVRKRQKRRYFADVSRLLPLTYVVVLVLAGLFASTLYLDIAHPISLK